MNWSAEHSNALQRHAEKRCMIERVWPDCLHCGSSFSCFPGELWPFQRSFYTAVQDSGVSTPQSQHSGVFYTAVATQRSSHTAVQQSGVSTPQLQHSGVPHRSSVQVLKEVRFHHVNTALQLSARGGNVESRRATTVDSCDSFMRDRKADLGTSKRQPEETKLSLAARQASLELE